jgi:hypothetical protein
MPVSRSSDGPRYILAVGVLKIMRRLVKDDFNHQIYGWTLW